MPTYTYACTECGNRFDIQQSFSDSSLTECPTCAGRLRKVFSAVGVVFKGSGFYRNDSRSSGSDGNGSAGKDSASDSVGKDSAKDSGKDGAAKDSTTAAKTSDSSSGAKASDSTSSGSSADSSSSSSSAGTTKSASPVSTPAT